MTEQTPLTTSAQANQTVNAMKAPTGTVPPTAQTSASSSFKLKEPRKIFGLDVRSVATVLGLTLFFVAAMAGVLIAIRQRTAPEDSVAPNAPQSRPQAAGDQSTSCTVRFTVQPDATESPSPTPTESPSPTPTESPTPTPPTVLNCVDSPFTETFADASYADTFFTYGDANSVGSGRLNMSIAAGASDPRAGLRSKYAYSGDFDTSIEVPAFSSQADDRGQIRLVMDMDEDISTGVAPYVMVYYQKTTGGLGKIVSEARNVTPVVVNSISFQPGMSLRIVREGSTISTYYSTGNSFTKIAEYNGVSESLIARVLLRPDQGVAIADAPLTTGSFDNFKLVCPTDEVEPSPTPTTPPVVYSCNSSCTTDAQCQTANGDFVCSDQRCRLKTNTASESCSVPPQTYACNSTCETNANCQTANSSYICALADNGYRCRLDSNPGASNCQVAVNPTPTPTATPTATPTGSSTPVPTPTVGCGNTCVTNADCTNADHICYNTGSANICRLASNPTNSSCAPSTIASNPGTTTPGSTTPGTTSQPGQPQLPAELPQTGAEDLVKWLGPGVGALLIGALVLFFL